MTDLFETLGSALNPNQKSFLSRVDSEMQKRVKLLKQLTCSQCKDIKDRLDQMHYSQGSLVCEDCKKLNHDADKKAFDRDMKLR